MKNFTVYRSSAGSGKTYTLAVNYLALAISKSLIKRDYYKKILAITFTNKAAQEMKERVLYYLNLLSQGKDIDNILSEISLKTGLKNEDIFKISKDIRNKLCEKANTLDKVKYLNPMAFILGYLATNGGTVMDKKTILHILNNLELINDETITKPDIIRYSRYWMKIN